MDNDGEALAQDVRIRGKFSKIRQKVHDSHLNKYNKDPKDEAGYQEENQSSSTPSRAEQYQMFLDKVKAQNTSAHYRLHSDTRLRAKQVALNSEI